MKAFTKCKVLHLFHQDLAWFLPLIGFLITVTEKI